MKEENRRNVYWAGRQWCVTEYGLETIRPGRYLVEAERLGDLSHGKVPKAERLRHVAEKTWVDVEDLIAAFSVAVLVHAGKFDPLPAEAMVNALADLRMKRWRSEEHARLDGPNQSMKAYDLNELHKKSAKVDGRLLKRISDGPPFQFVPDPAPGAK